MKIIINKKNKFLNFFILLLFLIIILTIFFSALINIYKHKDNIKNFFSNNAIGLQYEREHPTGHIDRVSDIKWAKKIREGGYILWIRHAHRNKWQESVAYLDAYALINNIDEAESSFSTGTCLSRPRGVEGAKILGKIMSQNNIKISEVWSSPSCRSKETAMFAFGKVDKIYNCILHTTAFNISQHKSCGKRIKKLILNYRLPNNKNLIISGHGNTVETYTKDSFFSDDYSDSLDLDEGGFFVLQKDSKNEKIKIVYKFKRFKSFANALYQIKIN